MSESIEKHFVTFYSPGTFVAEQTEKPIRSWSVATAKRMASKITERYGAKPYGFQFTTRGRGKDDLDSRVVKRSGMYYLHAKVETLEEIKARNDPRDSILIANMECNKWPAVVTNGPKSKTYKFTRPLQDGDVVLP